MPLCPSAPRAVLANLCCAMVLAFFCGARNLVPPDWRVGAGLCGVAFAVPPVPPRHDGPTLEEPLTCDVAEPETPPEALEAVGVPPGHQAGEPQCVCCFYRTSLRIDDDLRTPGWRWSSCPSQLPNAPHGWQEGWVWHHGNSPHAPFEFRHQRTGPQPHMNPVLGPHGSDSRGLMGQAYHAQPGGPPRNTLEALQAEVYQDPTANDPAMAEYLDRARLRRIEAREALPSAPPQGADTLQAFQDVVVPQDLDDEAHTTRRIQYLRQVHNQMLANASLDGRFRPRPVVLQAIEAVLEAGGFDWEEIAIARGPLRDPPGPPPGPPPRREENEQEPSEASDSDSIHEDI